MLLLFLVSFSVRTTFATTFKQGFWRFLLKLRGFLHSISPPKSEKCDSTFGTKIIRFWQIWGMCCVHVMYLLCKIGNIQLAFRWRTFGGNLVQYSSHFKWTFNNKALAFQPLHSQYISDKESMQFSVLCCALMCSEAWMQLKVVWASQNYSITFSLVNIFCSSVCLH